MPSFKGRWIPRWPRSSVWIATLDAAVHVSAPGTSRRFAAMQQFGRTWRVTGHVAGIAEPTICEDARLRAQRSFELQGRMGGSRAETIRQPRDLSMLKTPKRWESLEICAPPPYRRGHDHDSFHRRFHPIHDGITGAVELQMP
jgi:hypothetical protein